MTPRFYRWAIALSWSLIGLAVLLIIGGIALGQTAPPAWAGVVTAMTLLVAVPVGLWSPVGLLCAHARARGTAPRMASVGIILAWVSAFLTFVVITSGNTFTSPGLWNWLARASLPVMLFTLACALSVLASMIPAGPRAKRSLASGVVSLFAVAIVVTGMVIVDSGNRVLFGLLALLLAWAVMQAFLVLILTRRAAAR